MGEESEARDARAMSGKNNPSEFLKTVLGRPVVVKLNSGVDYRGARRPKPPHAAVSCMLSNPQHRWAAIDALVL